METRTRSAAWVWNAHYYAQHCWKLHEVNGDVHSIDLPPWPTRGAEKFGLHRELWPPEYENEFSEFERRYTKNPDVQLELDSVSTQGVPFSDRLELDTIRGFESMICGALGFAKQHAPELFSASLAKTLVELCAPYIKWHKEVRCNGIERSTHEKICHQIISYARRMGISKAKLKPLRTLISVLKIELLRTLPEELLFDYGKLLADVKHELDAAQREFLQLLRQGKIKNGCSPAALRYRNALICACLVFRPLRSRNVRQMYTGKNIIRTAERWHLKFLKSEVKGKKIGIDLPHSDSLTPYLDCYAEQAQPVFNVAGLANPPFFMTKTGKLLCSSDLAAIVANISIKLWGHRLNPHAFRTLVGSGYLASSPADPWVIQLLLGHRFLSTTLKFYIERRRSDVAKLNQEFLRTSCPHLKELGLWNAPRFCKSQREGLSLNTAARGGTGVVHHF